MSVVAAASDDHAGVSLASIRNLAVVRIRRIRPPFVKALSRSSDRMRSLHGCRTGLPVVDTPVSFVLHAIANTRLYAEKKRGPVHAVFSSRHASGRPASGRGFISQAHQATSSDVRARLLHSWVSLFAAYANSVYVVQVSTCARGLRP
jgi:hypothetical protein